MTTLAPVTIKSVVPVWEDEYSSAVFSGIVGDLAHRKRGGYHISIQDQSASNFSVVRADDAAPPGDWSRKDASALDMSMSKTDMVTSTRRWVAVWADKSDPRRKYFNAVNGWLGSGDAKRWDFVKNTVQTSTNDHQWHQHSEWRRRYANDPKAARAAMSITKGESKATWIAREEGPPPVVTYKPASRDLSLRIPHLEGPDVLFLQQYIGGGKIKVDGDFGPATEARVKWYQNMRGLQATGRVDRRMWQEMGITPQY